MILEKIVETIRNKNRIGGGTIDGALPPGFFVSNRLCEEDPHPPRVLPCSVSGYDEIEK